MSAQGAAARVSIQRNLNVATNIPSNRRKRAERVEQWNKSLEAGRKFKPTVASGDDARYLWISAVIRSDLTSTTRLVAHTLATHGLKNGEKIFPSTRLLAVESRLSERAVCEHLDRLVRRGFLRRKTRSDDGKVGRGFTYVLCIPQVLTQDQHSMGATNGSADPASARRVATDRRSAPC